MRIGLFKTNTKKVKDSKREKRKLTFFPLSSTYPLSTSPSHPQTKNKSLLEQRKKHHFAASTAALSTSVRVTTCFLCEKGRKREEMKERD